MADAQANIGIGIDTTQALAAIRQLQREISVFHTLMAKGGANVAAESLRMRQGLINNINETGKFSARMTQISSSTETFTNALEKNKFSMGQYFRYAGASTKTFGKLFSREFNTISRVAEERVKDLQTQYISMGRDANGALQAIKVRPLALDMDNLQTKTLLAAQKQQLLNQLLKQGSTNLLNFGKNTQWAGRQLMVGFTIPLTIFGSIAAREFQKLEEQAIKFRRVYGDMFTTTGETERALENVRELAEEFTKYGIAVEKTVGLAARVAQMGNMGDALDAQVRQATRLSVLGGLEQEEALDTTISLTNAFGVSIEELSDKVNFLNAAENQTILSIEDFNEAIPKAGSVVKALGGDVEDLAFFLTAMREGGISAAQGANALKSSLGRLINPTEEARKRLANLGIDVVGIVEANAGNLRGTVMSLAEALDTLDPLQKSRAIEQLFGKFQFARMSTMFNNIVDSGSQANKVLQLTGSTVQELGILADREMGRVEDSVAYKFSKSLEEFKATLAPLGEAFLKAVTPLVEFGTKILNKFNDMSDGAKQFVVVMAAVLGAIGPVALMSFGLLANGVANLMKMFANLGIFYQKLTGQSKSLGMSTEYMTQEQIEAAAVAASLNQSHATLIQTFSAEATAVDRLTAAYTKAIAAQRGFKGGNVARGGAAGVTPKKYASGVTSVPGPKGAGDIVPAMLSPGEAVIPAKQAEKYSGFIKAIFNDDLPGYRFGLNPFAMMMGRSRVATRMQSTDLLSSLRAKDLRYKSGFATGTGADFTDRLGRPMKQHQLMRRQAENKLYGTPVGSNDPSMRPTYGSVATTPMGRILNLLFGRKGRQFNQVTNPMASNLDQYGDISLIGKRSMNNRASTFVGDTLLKYSKNPAWVRGTAPMRGATQSQRQQAGFDTFNNPFGAIRDGKGGVTQNTAPQYIEAQTMGGFNYNEVKRIIAKDPAVRKQLREELKRAGIRQTKVRGSEGITSALFKMLGVPGFKDGILSVPGFGNEDKFPAMLAPGEAVIPAKMADRYAPVINSMISGKLPGFETGLEADQKKQTTTKAPTRPAKVTGYTNAVMYLPSKENLALNRGGADVKNIRSAIKTGGAATQAPMVDSIARSLGKTSDPKKIAQQIQSNPEFKKFATNINKSIATALPKSGKISDPQFQKLATAAIDKELKTGGYSKAFQQAGRQVLTQPTAFQDPSSKRIRMSNGRPKLDLEGRGQIKHGTRYYRRDYKASIQALGGRASMFEGQHLSHMTKSKQIDLSKISGPLTKSAAEAADRIRRGVEKIRFGTKASEFKAGTDLATAQKKLGAETAAKTKQTKESTKAEKKATEQTKKNTAASKKQAKAVEKASNAVATKKPGKIVSTVDKNGNVRYYQDGKRIQNKVGEAAQARSARAQKAAQTRAANRAATPAPAPEAGKAAARSKIGMGGVAGLGMVGAMAASFAPGKIGQVAQQLIFPLMMLPTILPLLKNPIVLAVAAVASLGAAVFFLEKRLKDATSSGIDAGQAMSMTSDKLKSLSEVTGTVSATELRQAQQESQLTGNNGPEFNSFGIGFVQDSDQGKQMLEDIESQFNEGSTIDEVGGNIGRQLALAISQGAMSVDQARSIAGALGAELGDYTISTQISGKLTELLGIDGTDLTKDPLTVTLRIKEDSLREQAASFEQAISAIEPTVTPGGIARTTAGAGLIAAGGAMAGTGVGIIPGAAVALAGAVAMGTALWDQNQAMAENNKLAGAAMQLGVEQLSQNQMLVDSLNQQYDALIAQAETEEEINTLQERRQQGLQELNAENAKTTAAIMEQAKQLKNEGLYQDAMNASITQRYSEGPMSVFANEAISQLEDLENQDFAVSLSLQMATGELSPVSVLKLIEMGTSNESMQLAFETSMKEQGSAQTNQLIQLLTQAAVSDAQFPVLFDFVVKQDEDFPAALQALSVITSAETRYPVELDLEANGSDLIAQIMADLEKYQGLPDTITKEAFIELAGSDDRLQTIIDQWEELGLTGDISRQFIIDFVTLTSGDDSMVDRYFAESGVSRGYTYDRNLNRPVANTGAYTDEERMDAAAYFAQQRQPVTTQTNDPDPGDEGLDGGAGGAAPQVDSLLKKMRDLRLATINMRKGWDGMNESLKEFFKSGNKGFNGLSNQLRRIGVGEGLIERIVGMDPDEYEERKDELFVFDKEGNIVGTTEKLRNLGKAMNTIAIGEYINSQQSFIENTKNQFTAIQMLTAAGLSFVEAYEMVQDQALATAIAMGASREEIEELIRVTQAMTQMEKEYDRISEEKQAAKAVRQTNEEFNQRIKVLSKLASERGNYTDDEINAILNDPNTGRLFLDPSIDPSALADALEAARRQADLKLAIGVSTEEGKKGMFDGFVAEVQDEFSRQEAKIDIDFRLATKADSDIVSQAQDQIDAIQFEIDDYQAQLKDIGDQEEVINDKYADRYKALEDVAAANERISRIRAAELDIADALSRGDIAAAARAQQQLKATEAESRAKTEREMLEKQQEAELSRVRSGSGQSREEIEEKIKGLQDEIFGIEESQLEPAQERIRIAEYQKQLDIDSLDVAGKTRDQWYQISNLTDIATQNVDEFNKNVERALALYEYFVNGKPLDLSLFGAEQLNDLLGEGTVTIDEIVDSVIDPIIEEPVVDPTTDDGEDPDPGTPTPVKTPESIQKIKDAAKETVQKMVAQGVDSLTDFERILIGAPGATMSSGEFTRNALGSMMGSGGMNSLSPQERLMLGLEGGDKDGYVTKSVPDRRQTTYNPGGTTTRKPNITIKTPPSSSISDASKAKKAEEKKQKVIEKTHNAGVTKAKQNMAAKVLKPDPVTRKPAVHYPKATTKVNTKYGQLPSYIAAYLSGGGMVKGYAVGGAVARYAMGGQALGSDTIPAMLTQGEYVVRKRAVQDFGTENLDAINNGTYTGGSVYNYNLAVNVKSESDPDRIARTVMKQIQRVESQRVRGNRI